MGIEVRGASAELTWEDLQLKEDTWDVPVDREDSKGQATDTGEKRRDHGVCEGGTNEAGGKHESGTCWKQWVLEEGMRNYVQSR